MSSAQSQHFVEEIDRGLPHRQTTGNSTSTPGNPFALPVGLHLGEQFTVAPRPTLLQVNTVVVNFPDMISVLARRGN
jgi:hypothetical protein